MRTVQTSDVLKEKGYKVRQRTQLSQINPGVCEKMSERMIRQIYPDEVEKHELDPYHHRYPRAEVCFNYGLVKSAIFSMLISHSHTTIWLFA
jgi:6-phosphofructo-2-kinase/fructose-2,6-biphosphatase 4